MTRFLTFALAFTLAASVPVTIAGAQEKPAEKANDARGVAGVWALTMLSHQIGLELQQDGTALTGTLLVMGRSVAVEGTFVDGKLDLDGDGKFADRHGGEGVPIKIVGRLKDDGTLEGTVKTSRGWEEWTGERLGRR